jgi:protein-disulfide isomerase
LASPLHVLAIAGPVTHPAQKSERSPDMRLALALTALLVTPAMAEMTPEERAAFRDEVRSFLLENPEVIVEAMNELQARQDAEATLRDTELLAANRDALVNDGVSWVGGNPDGDITVVEFMDYRCGYCRKAFSEVEELVGTDGNIRFVLKELPILGPESLLASQFAIAVQQLHGAEGYKQAHDALMTLQADITAETLANLASDLGLDPAPVMTRMAGPEVRAVIEANHALATAMEVNGTPTFVVGDTLLRGYLPLEDMRSLVTDEREG